MNKELDCLCGSKGGTPVYKVCQGEEEHERKEKMNAEMAEFIRHLPELAKLLGDDGMILVPTR
jgi:hypothetical protein